MDITPDDQRRIAEALEHLRTNAWQRFENTLWLAFGDRWMHVRSMLAQQGYVALKGRWKDEAKLTERGDVLLQRLSQQPKTAAG